MIINVEYATLTIEVNAMVRMVVLGLLARQPLSGYQIQRYLEITQAAQWAGILPGSIYYALKRMDSQGLVTVEATQHTGHRSRVLYRITDAGRAEYLRLLRETWRTPTQVFPTGIYAALNFVDDLPRDEVIAAIDSQIDAIRAALAAWDEGEVAKAQVMGENPWAALTRVAFDNGRAHMKTDLELLQQIRDVLPAIPVTDWHPNQFVEDDAE
jgi:DNA-binding PadR family transcriptional regulator